MLESKKVSDRFSELLDFLGENKNSFSKKIGLNNNVTIGRIINGKSLPSFEILRKISNTYPKININWLVSGEGSITKEYNFNSLQNYSKDDILDFIIINSDDFRKEPKIDAIITLFSNMVQQREFLKIRQKINDYEKEIEELKKRKL